VLLAVVWICLFCENHVQLCHEFISVDVVADWHSYIIIASRTWLHYVYYILWNLQKNIWCTCIMVCTPNKL